MSRLEVNTMYIYFYKYPIGTLGIAESGNAICRICFGKDTFSGYTVKETPLINKTAGQFNEYFAGKRTEFDLPLEYDGTDFQRSVWNALLAIPFGETQSYKEVAESVGSPRACRAVGMANHRNPLAVIVPCHRVVEHGGGLGGYAGGLDAKRYLLDLEKNYNTIK
jgi:methylated-DNA-[protein]-cysteine S-methyltransferase